MTSTAIATAPAGQDLSQEFSQVVAEEKRFELAQRQAKVYSESTLVPAIYQGNIGNVLIATNMAHRMGADLLMVMQNLFIVHGKPGWSSQFLIATFNTCGRFTAIKYRLEGEEFTPDWGCVAYCTEKSTGEVIEGTRVTWAMANAEGWVNKNGSKWKTMPSLMFRYRSAAFLVRATAPEIAMGLYTKEELEDMDADNGSNGNSRVAASQGNLSSLRDKLGLVSNNPEPVDAVDGQIVDGEAIEGTAPNSDHVDRSALVAPPDTDPNDVPDGATEDLRAFVRDQLEALPKEQRNNLIKGKTPVSKADKTELEALQAALEGQA